MYDPHSHDAFGGDVPCMQFWINHEEDGPFYEIDDRLVYIESGSDPNELYEEFAERVEQRDE